MDHRQQTCCVTTFFVPSAAGSRGSKPCMLMAATCFNSITVDAHDSCSWWVVTTLHTGLTEWCQLLLRLLQLLLQLLLLLLRLLLQLLLLLLQLLLQLLLLLLSTITTFGSVLLKCAACERGEVGGAAREGERQEEVARECWCDGIRRVTRPCIYGVQPMTRHHVSCQCCTAHPDSLLCVCMHCCWSKSEPFDD